MNGSLRVIDSGLRTARENLALTQALALGHRAKTSPDTLRFQHFPASAIIGRHQILKREVDLDWTRLNNVATARRMTGGGAIVMGPGILGWELIVSRAHAPQALADVSRFVCTGVADGLKGLGVNAAYRERNDIEVDGRKISGTGGYFDGDTLVFQGTVLVELDRNLLTNALRLPAHKLGKRGLAALEERICDLRDCLGAAPSMQDASACVGRGIAAALGFERIAADVTQEEDRAAREVFIAEIGTEAFVTGAHDALAAGRSLHVARRVTPGGSMEVAISLRPGTEGIVDQLLVAGDFFVTPPRIVADLEAHLRGRPVRHLAATSAVFLSERNAAFLGAAQSDMVAAIEEASCAASMETPHG